MKRICAGDEAGVVEAALRHLKPKDSRTNLTGPVWRQANSVRVQRMEPVCAPALELLPLHVMRQSHSTPKEDGR